MIDVGHCFNSSRGPLAQIAMRLEPQAYSPKELIVFVGEVATRMYVIDRCCVTSV